MKYQVKSRKEIAQYLVETNFKDNLPFSARASNDGIVYEGVLALPGRPATPTYLGTFLVTDEQGTTWTLPKGLIEEVK